MTQTDALEKSFIERTIRRRSQHKVLDVQTEPPPPGEPTVTVSEVSHVLGTTRPSIYRAIESGKLVTYKSGDYRVTTQPQLAKWKGEATSHKVMAGAQWLRFGDPAVKTARARYVGPYLENGADPVNVEEMVEQATGRAIARVLKDRAIGRDAVAKVVMEEFSEVFEED